VTRPFRHLSDCYGCGAANPLSPGISLTIVGHEAHARVCFGSHHQGAPGLVHGGLLALLLDETMGTVPLDRRGIRLTTDMTIRYRRPTPIAIELLCRARVAAWMNGGASMDATIVALDAQDVVLVEGSASYVWSTSLHA
jgi:acyl-coenzyme A thioesterase PaaI-like protein